MDLDKVVVTPTLPSASASPSQQHLRSKSATFAAAGNVALRASTTSMGMSLGRRAERMTTKASAAPAVVAAADAAAEPPTSGGFVWKGAKIIPALISIAVGLVVKFIVPCPAAVLPQAWTLLAIFLSTITGLVLTPLPVGAWVGLSRCHQLHRVLAVLPGRRQEHDPRARALLQLRVVHSLGGLDWIRAPYRLSSIGVLTAT